MDTKINVKRGVTTVAFGQIGFGSHTEVECIYVDSGVDASRVLERVDHRFFS